MNFGCVSPTIAAMTNEQVAVWAKLKTQEMVMRCLLALAQQFRDAAMRSGQS